MGAEGHGRVEPGFVHPCPASPSKELTGIPPEKANIWMPASQRASAVSSGFPEKQQPPPGHSNGLLV